MTKSDIPALVTIGCLAMWLGLLSLKLAGFVPVVSWSWWWVFAPLWWWPAWCVLRAGGSWLRFLIRTKLLRR